MAFPPKTNFGQNEKITCFEVFTGYQPNRRLVKMFKNCQYFLITYGVFSAATNMALGDLIFTEDWESPVATTAVPSSPSAPWFTFTGGGGSIFRPDSSSNSFNSTLPLSSPAGGNQYLELSGMNSGIYRVTGVMIAPGTTYTISAAIGNNLSTPGGQNWSLQFWADTNANGIFDGAASDTFITQQFGTSGVADIPDEGEWVNNSVSFDSDLVPAVIGQDIFVFLNNFQSGVSSYDNVSLESAVTAIPEPSNTTFISVLLFLAAFFRQRL